MLCVSAEEAVPGGRNREWAIFFRTVSLQRVRSNLYLRAVGDDDVCIVGGAFFCGGLVYVAENVYFCIPKRELFNLYNILNITLL